jgi:hypothetical protein
MQTAFRSLTACFENVIQSYVFEAGVMIHLKALFYTP